MERLRRPDPATLVGGIGLVVLALLTWQVAVGGPLVGWDDPVHRWADANRPYGVLGVVGDLVARLGGQRLFTLPVLIGVALWVALSQRRLRPLVATVTGLLVVAVPGYLIKFLLGRSAPAAGIDELGVGGQAFPSGHTANATLTWALVVLLLVGAHGRRPDPSAVRRWMPVAVLVAGAVGVAMTVLDYHWLTDSVGGWALGALALGVAHLVLQGRISPLPVPSRAPAAPSRSRRSPHRGR